MTEKTEQELLQAFQKDYEVLCKKHGLQLVFVPQWKQSMDTGTFSLVIIPQAAKYEPETDKPKEK